MRATREANRAIAAEQLAERRLTEVDQQRQRAEENYREAETARQQAETNRQQADARQREVEAVLSFVEEKVFAAARPAGQDGGLGHNVALREAVEQALPYVAESFADQPLIQARLRMTLGNAFRDLGLAKTAEEQYERARALYTAYLGPDHPKTLTSMQNLAASYHPLGRYEEALALGEETLRLYKEKLGPDHPGTLRSMQNLANVEPVRRRGASLS